MADLDVFSARAAHRTSIARLSSAAHQGALVICGAAHVGLWIGGGVGSVHGGGDGFVVERLAAQRAGGLGRIDGRKSDTAEGHGGFVQVSPSKVSCTATLAVG